MLEQLLIFTRGGLILWTCKELGNALKGSPIDALILSCLLEEWSCPASYNYDAASAAYTLKWTFHNELGLVFVSVYQRILHLLYVDDLLVMVKREFLEVYDPKQTAFSDFDETFKQLKKEAEARAEDLKRLKQLVGKSLNNIKKQGQMQNARFEGVSNKKSESASPSDGGDDYKVNVGANSIENGSSDAGAFDVNKLQKLRAKGGKKDETLVSKGSKAEPKKKITRKNSVWDDSPPQAKLDFTDDVSENGDNIEVVAVDHGESMMDKEEIFSMGKDSKPETKKNGWFSTMFQSIASKANMENSDLEPALKALKDRLLMKNVAEEIAEKLCESMAASLEGKKLASFTRISSIVQAAMEEALVRILTPRCSVDILRDVHAAREQRKPYIVFISIFEKGYEKDPAILAKEAVQEATHNGSDVVLVDTASRMQDNEPLMRALSKLIYLNNPDLVLFVGEALVGNDAVDQLSKFNQKLANLSTSARPRLINGILFTKFDAIDDKVVTLQTARIGAALSMVYISGQPKFNVK
ncbi:hypothetical protein I3842_16G107900 [Carya illinoinensis]|uniref:SRP54-type proteins GTP-binding domain-containing protein n=1 Tax=Carya illinoinensis TaxID=32201 RepID=A0A922D6A3_CARIL|nr:hypothetical protein I3842_16G107900 [Carya illinoinensis]